MNSFLATIRFLLCVACMAGMYPITSEAQWKAVFYREEITDTVYDIRSDPGFNMKKDFIFPEYSYCENMNALTGAVDCISPISAAVWHKSFGGDIDLTKDPSAVFLRVYTENIRQYTYFFYSYRNHKWQKKVVPLSFSGYQIPATSRFSDWSDSVISLRSTEKADTGACDRLIIGITATDTSLPWKFVIGDLAIGAYKRSVYPATNNFFSNLSASGGLSASTGDNSNVIAASYHHTVHSDYLEKIPEGMDGYSLWSKIEILPEGSPADSGSDRLLLRKVIESSLQNYPYYEERNLDKTLIIGKFSDIFRSARTLSYCSLVDSLSQFIRYTFNDLHFYIDYPGDPCQPHIEDKQRPPVRIVTLGGKFLVGAVFDSAYGRIGINDIVIAIDGVPVQEVFDREAVRLFGTSNISDYEKSTIASSLLDRNRNDSCSLRTFSASRSAISETLIKYNKKYSIPETFRPVHGEYRRYGDIAYFRINYWDESIYLRFINHWDDIRNANKIIFDLRGNGGGEMTGAMQLFSIFIGQPENYYWNIDKKGKPVAIKVLPDRSFSYPSSRKIVILGDQSTACCSEAFIKALQNRGNTVFIGASNTAGSFAAKFDITLPSGVVVHVNSLLTKVYYQPGLYEIENKGITPDVLVKINRVEDLRPYDDKILREAIKILSDKRD